MVAATELPFSSPSPSNLHNRLWSEDLQREHGFEPLTVEGNLPAELRGTLYRNGPAQFGQFGVKYTHAFEADGAITAIRFDGGKAQGACKLTPSAGLVEERAAGQMHYGLKAPWLRRVANSLRRRIKNTANTSVMMWQGRLYALMEAALPTEIGLADLAMRGDTNFDHTIVSAFSAHPHRVASRRAMYNFGVEYGRKNKICMYELPDVGAARQLGTIDIDGAPMLHDFIATDTHLVFFLSPVRMDVPRMLLQLGTFEQMFKWKPELGTEVICVPIDRPTEPVRFHVDAFYQWHFTNAFTRGNELVIDYVRYPDFGSFYEIGALARGGGYQAMGDGAAHRAVVDLTAKTLRSAPTLARSVEFPTIAPGREATEHGLSYLTIDEARGVASLDTRTGAVREYLLPDTQRVTEPLFVPRSGATREDDGWLLALAHDDPSDRAFVAVYDAARIPDGEVARAWFDHQVPITFHGVFAPAE